MTAEKWNQTINFSHTEFILLGFPGVSEYRQLLSIPFLSLYLVSMLGNSLLIYVIWREESLHFPMFVLMSALSTVHICNLTNIIPRMLLGLIFNLNLISLPACLIQMFINYCGVILESSILVVMAIDRYVAICKPLRYADIMNKTLLVQLAVAVVVLSVCIASYTVLRNSQAQFCGSNIIHHYVCENMALMLLACSGISKNNLVGMTLSTMFVCINISFILFSYVKILHAALKIAPGSIRHKALQTCGTQLIIIALTYISNLLSSAMYRAGKSVSQDIQNLFSVAYVILPATADPIIYGVRVKEIRECIRKLLKVNVVFL
ncbi:olfactory receptor 52K1-like [Rhinatrema bivittatum]|uniref:olfactory receptor 52K1-like n=1 Tax=Rhinatrema bivittatum TaxID=194408 RepID=UPI001127E6B6|nr:olfactory receptor 52K1-like [Rhinatrema bivittatum]